MPKLMIWAMSPGKFMPRSPIPSRVTASVMDASCSSDGAWSRLKHEADRHRHDQGVDGDGLGEGDAQDHVGLNDGLGFRIAAQGLQGLARQHADTYGGPGAADGDGQSGADEA